MFKMKNAFFIVIAILFFSLIPINIVDAHSTLEEAIPNEGEQLEETTNRIELSFSTIIENGSTLYIVNEGSEEIEPSSINITDNVLEATFEEPLKPGEYQVNWEIIGADGHLIENEYSFSIAETTDNSAQVEDDQNNDTSNSDTSNEEIGSEQSNQETNQENSTKQQTGNDSDQFPLVSGIIIFLIIAGIVLLAWMLFSKRKNKE